MSIADIFGYKWETILLTSGFGLPIWECREFHVGLFYTTNINELYCNYDEFYKVIALIHEKTIFNTPFFITSKENIDALKVHKSDFATEKYILCTIEECLISFPIELTDKQNRILLLLKQKYPKHGFVIQGSDVEPYHFFSENNAEYLFIVESMNKKELLNAKLALDDSDGNDFIMEMQIGSKGWEEIENNFNIKNSKQGFIAMWFDDSMKEARKQIKKAIAETNYFIPQIIDEKQFNDDITDEIILEISNSRFLIADLTGQRGGVYFEAGYAFAKSIPVVFTCKKGENVHFDVRQYNTIFWNDEEELYSKLKDRILGTIVFQGNQ